MGEGAFPSIILLLESGEYKFIFPPNPLKLLIGMGNK